jgi:predicted nucleic-acid-binding protein
MRDAVSPHGSASESVEEPAFSTAGGDFADGVIAYEGSWLGGETFISFDKKAVSLIARLGLKAKLLA